MSAPDRVPSEQAPAACAAAASRLGADYAAASRLGPADRLVARLLDLDSARSLALDALVSVAAIEWTGDVATACVECAERPRILLNPCFVEEWCRTPEMLAMLLLHELAHVSFGHTRLYPRATPVQNVAFDAVINAHVLAVLNRRGLDPDPYAALLRAYYPADQAPGFLLRPPDGWPERPRLEKEESCPEALREVHARLYPATPLRHPKFATPPGAPPPAGPDDVGDVTYGEIVSALRTAGVADAEPGLLLGGHGETEREAAAESSGRDAAGAELLGKVLTAIGIGDGLPSAGPGLAATTATLERRRAERVLERAIEHLLRHVFVDVGDARATREDAPLPILTVDPTLDRRAAVRRAAAAAFGAPAPLLFRGEAPRTRPDRHAAVVYLDVSGSMTGLVERLHAALLRLHRLLAPSVYVFSTEVVEVGRAAFLEGRIRTTWGTAVAPVVEHLLGLAGSPTNRGRRRVDRGLLLTDGYFGPPPPALVRGLRDAGARLHLGIIGGGPLHEGEPWVASATRLPDPSYPNFESRP